MKNKFELRKNKIDIWQYELHNDPKILSEYLNAEEKQRANRYYFSKHQRRFTNARGMLRVILARYLQMEPAQLCFNENNYGKPELQNNTILQFNLSHSEDLALLAVGMNSPLGVDVEYFAERPYLGIAKNMFSSREIEQFSNVPETQQPTMFYHVWAQKEAFIKACGLGLSYPTQEFSVPVTPYDSPKQVYDGLHDTTWNMQTFRPNSQCYAAICYALDITEINYGLL